MTNTKDRVNDAAANLRPYVERALRDQELRRNVQSAYSSARAVYDELSRRRGVGDAATRLANDRDVQNELRNAIEELRNAAARVQGVRRETEHASHGGRNSLLLFAGVVIGILLNPLTGPAVRRALANAVFGRANGFVYRGNGTGSDS